LKALNISLQVCGGFGTLWTESKFYGSAAIRRSRRLYYLQATIPRHRKSIALQQRCKDLLQTFSCLKEAEPEYEIFHESITFRHADVRYHFSANNAPFFRCLCSNVNSGKGRPMPDSRLLIQINVKDRDIAIFADYAFASKSFVMTPYAAS
jgi:hypothetical protein